MKALHFQQRQVTCGAQSRRLAPPMVGRVFLAVQNQDAAMDVYVRINNVATTDANSVKIRPGEYFEFRDPCSPEEFNIAATGDTQNVCLIEGVDGDAAKR